MATVAAVGGALGAPTSGPSPPIATSDASTDPRTGNGAGSVTPTAPAAPAPAESAAEPDGTASAVPGSPTTDSSGSRGSASTDAATPSPGRPSSGTVLAVREIGRLGPVVVDADGFTLYRYDGDAAGAATCADACVSTWPPATVDPTARMAVEGLRTADVGFVRRRDGTVQLTLGGWPVYRFAGDARPGRDGGQGIGGAWFAITPTGEKANAP